MSNTLIPWERFWCPLGGEIHCDHSGEDFLTDPEDRFGHRYNPQLVEFNQLPDLPCLVLCGEPGMGKTSALEISRPSISSRLSSDDSLFWVSMRSIPSEETFIRRTLASDSWQRWRTSDHKHILIIDGVDEGLFRISNFVRFLTEELRNLPLSRLQLILVCRSAEWPPEAGQQLVALWGLENKQAVFELCPLRQRDVRLAAEIRRVNADAFIQALYDQHVVSLAARPITLFFLLDEFAEKGSFPGTHRDLYKNGCLRLCEDPDHERIEALRSQGKLDTISSPAQLHQVAKSDHRRLAQRRTRCYIKGCETI